MKTDIGLIGLGVMGSNLARNMASKGFAVSCCDWSDPLRKRFAESHAEGFVHAENLKEFVASIKRPRKIMLMVKTGFPVDSVLNELTPLLEPGDVVIDGGNSQWEDTGRRLEFLEEKGLLYIGCGVSGGEEGALNGPALMPGGSAIASPAMSSAFSYYDGVRTARGSANLLQAQRDCFGAHTCERTDKPRGEFFHTQWT